jgi:exonuclease III
MGSVAFGVLHVNIRGYASKSDELQARIKLMEDRPLLICINETFLDQSTEEVSFEGYETAARRDRSERSGGGVLVLVKKEYAKRVVGLGNSERHERSWLMVHTEQGPILVCAWYRPPVCGEVDSIVTLAQEWREHRENAIGSIIVGDVNCHHRDWLKWSSQGVSSEGKALRSMCARGGLQQIVNEPTRGVNLLDLVLTDIEGTKAVVLPKIADHELVKVSVRFSIPLDTVVRRRVWSYQKADWDLYDASIDEVCLDSTSWAEPNEAVAFVSNGIRNAMETAIPSRSVSERKSTHPWLNCKVMESVDARCQAVGTEQERVRQDECGKVICAERRKYEKDVCKKLADMKANDKQWWSMARQLLRKKNLGGNIPSLRREKKEWLFTPEAKADHLADTFAGKCVLPPAIENAYSFIHQASTCHHGRTLEVNPARVEILLSALVEKSGTGPDLIPTRVLRRSAKKLAVPLSRLIQLILSTGVWPDEWKVHWIQAIYKKKSAAIALNYRGVHLTAQISKVAERAIAELFITGKHNDRLFGANQFAYGKGRGGRDALAYLTLKWILALAHGHKVSVFCSDVAGAFDRVKSDRLVAKLRAKGIHPTFVAVVESWLVGRTANVIVEGKKSRAMELSNMVFQGTVLGPPLWNIFFADAKEAIEEWLYEEVIYADDLNAFRIFLKDVDNEVIKTISKCCQAELHSWGEANQVKFDPGKESHHVLSRTAPDGEDFAILGATYDGALTMGRAVSEVVIASSWRVTSLLRTRRYYHDGDLMMLYKQQILSLVEHRTPAIHHAMSAVLQPLDNVQIRFLKALDISEVDALVEYNLAPLACRRDMAILGMLHRAVIGAGPPHFRKLFGVRTGHVKLPDKEEYTSVPLLRRSAFGYISIYNGLPVSWRRLKTVKEFQGLLQKKLTQRAVAEVVTETWKKSFSPRAGARPWFL